MKILSVGGEDVKAAASFDYHGWTVSFSTIFKGPVMAWNNKNADEIEGRTVQEVLDHILKRGLFCSDNTTFTSRSGGGRV